MSRCRNIKPGLWLNEDLAELSITARYLFPGLWCLADKDGRLEYRPKKIKAELFPYDDVDIASLAGELHGKKFISIYENEGSLYLQINNFKKHQNPHPKEKANGYPDPVNICTYDGNLKQFIFTASNVQIPFPSFPSSSLIPSTVEQKKEGAGSLRKKKETEHSPSFDTFYASYPKKQNKEGARKSWAKINPDDTLLQTILDAVEVQSNSEAWTKDKGKYVPMPATWLNNRRWEDQIETIKSDWE